MIDIAHFPLPLRISYLPLFVIYDFTLVPNLPNIGSQSRKMVTPNNADWNFTYCLQLE